MWCNLPERNWKAAIDDACHLRGIGGITSCLARQMFTTDGASCLARQMLMTDGASCLARQMFMTDGASSQLRNYPQRHCYRLL